MVDAAMVECPGCRGSGLRFYCENFHDCMICEGEGEITPAEVARIKAVKRTQQGSARRG